MAFDIPIDIEYSISMDIPKYRRSFLIFGFFCHRLLLRAFWPSCVSHACSPHNYQYTYYFHRYRPYWVVLKDKRPQINKWPTDSGLFYTEVFFKISVDCDLTATLRNKVGFIGLFVDFESFLKQSLLKYQFGLHTCKFM